MGLVDGVLAGAQGAGADGVQEGVGGVLVAGEARDLGDGARRGDALVVAAQAGVGVDERGLGDHVERAALGEQEVVLREELGARGEAAPGLAGALRHGAELGAVRGEERQDEVLLAELGAVEHDGPRAKGAPTARHGYSSDE